MKLLKILDPAQNILSRINVTIDLVEDLKNEYRKLSDRELKIKTKYFLKRIELGETVDDLLAEALASVREAAYRVHGIFAYPVQLMGALVIYEGNFAEMKTGEGKTLTIAMAAYIAALSKAGVHVVTVNEYLVKRDAEFSRKIFNFLGMSVGFNTSNMSKPLKKAMFKCDVTYTTNSELAFDYLRDNMVNQHELIVIPRLNFAIIDEGDSILIDEASTPLIISAPAQHKREGYVEVSLAVQNLKESDVNIDWETKSVTLLTSGILKLESMLRLKKLYVFDNSEIINKIHNALIAHFVFTDGKEYIVKNEKIMLIDQYTGRILADRSYNNGLQQAIQAKEYLKIEDESKIAAKITYQSFFRLYKKLASLSGTAINESKEFQEIYNMIVVQVPTNKKIKRLDLPDVIFGSRSAKVKQIVEEIKKHYLIGQPVLVGTSSVSESEIIFAELNKWKIPCEILNAKNHDREAEIISKAGQKYAITIATNIAGRGVDIKINKEVSELGGLYVLGCEKNESKRVDDQLRGRSGRQGDPGKSIFFVSLEDNIFKRFGVDKFEKTAKKIKDEYFDSKFLSKTITNIQKKIQYAAFDGRKNLIEYNEVLCKQQEIVYKQRNFVLKSTNNFLLIKNMISKVAKTLSKKFIGKQGADVNESKNLSVFLNSQIFSSEIIGENYFVNKNREWSSIFIEKCLIKAIEEKKEKLKEYDLEKLFKDVIIRHIDIEWQNHLEMSEKLKNNIHLRSMEQKSPLNIYVEQIGEWFDELLYICRKNIIREIVNLPNSFIDDICIEYAQNLRFQNFKNLKN